MRKGALSTEYSAVRDGSAGVIDLSSRGRLLVSGLEAVMFLNGLITNDMKTLAVNSWMPAAFPNVQGRLLASVRVIHRKDGFVIDTESATRETVFKLLERFTLAGDFRVLDLMEQFHTVFERLLERFSSRDEPHTTCTLIDNCCFYRIEDIVVTRRASGINKANTTHIVVDNLIAGKINRMI